MPLGFPPGSRVTSLASAARAMVQRTSQRAAQTAQTARTTISSVNLNTWFGPSQPLAPMAPQEPEEGVKGRKFDYPVGFNLNYNPRSTAPVSFATLRTLADSCDLLRIAIESRKDQMASLSWVIRPREGNLGNPGIWAKLGPKAHPDLPQETKDRIKAITQFFEYPDKEHAWDQWLKEWMEEVLVVDAASIYKQRDRVGRLYSLENIDGSLIKPLIGADGRRPKPPDPAYQEILHGIPAADFTSDELFYLPWNVRTNTPYGYSKVEQIIITINTSIRRTLSQLDYYTEGTQPDAFMGLPKDWSFQNIKEFQDYMDLLMAGNPAQRRKLRFVPGEFKYQETKQPPLKDVFDEFLARIICFTFAIAPDPFIEHVSRGAVEKSHTRAAEGGLEPMQSYVKTVADRIITEDFGSPDLEFKFVENLEQDPKTQMEINTGYASRGIFTIDEVRLDQGKTPFGGPASIPMVMTKSGYVPLATFASPEAAQALSNSGERTATAVLNPSGGKPAANANATKFNDEGDDDEDDDEDDITKILEKLNSGNIIDAEFEELINFDSVPDFNPVRPIELIEPPTYEPEMTSIQSLLSFRR